MVSADNLNYDVLSLIFSYLGNNDLVSACLVSQSFKAGAVPRLYRKVYFRLDQMKRWPKVQSPFTSICENPNLARHVHHCEIKALPKTKGVPDTRFMTSCIKAFRMFCNLVSFTCLVNVGPFLPALSTKERLAELKLHAALNLEQTKALSKINNLHGLSLFEPSLGVCHALLTWIPKLSATLRSVKITNSRDINETVLQTIVKTVPKLESLHILGCPKIPHQKTLQMINFSRYLRYISITTWENDPSTFDDALTLPHLQHFTVDTRNSYSQQSIPSLYMSLFRAVSASPLKSITIKLSEPMIMADPFIVQLVVDHHQTLTRFNCVNVDMTTHSLQMMCMACVSLEQLSIGVPKDEDELEDFLGAIEGSGKLHTLIDISESHAAHGQTNTLDAEDIREIFSRVDTLEKVITGNRSWTCTRTAISDEGYMYFDEDSDEDEYDDTDEDEEDINRSTRRRKIIWDIKLRWEKLRLSKNPPQTLVETINGC
ncbi:hypothetical protein M422DRAFT_28190 [Sphaerobolus stellatus SS14]|nr:hypothetical protein M422DRAFT_28190 [Sphaerobolus stellatus SS14]